MKVTLMICILALFADAQSPDGRASSRQPNGQPISSILNTDGSMKRGISGSFDPKGFRMANGPDGAPRFVPETEASSSLPPTTGCNDGWDVRFWTNGPNGSVYAVATDNAGNIYVGGGFVAVGNLLVNNIAKWDGSSWSALGSGMNGGVRAISVSGTDVYAGGHFTTAGGVEANAIAKWDGSSWSALGSGVDDSSFGGAVYAIAVSDTDIYAGGYFNSAGEVAANNIAKWNGSSWSALGSGVEGGGSQTPGVRAIAVSGPDVYVGGWFATAGGGTVNSIAKWNGSSWSALGSGVNGYPGVYAIAVSGNGEVYAGGAITSAGGMAANKIAKWNGSSWSTLESDLSGNNVNQVYVSSLKVSGADVIVGGYFRTAGGAPANNIAKWNGSSWSALGAGVGNPIVNDYGGPAFAIAVSGSSVYVGGSFNEAGGVSANNIAKWDGSSWSAVGPNGKGINGIVSAIAVSGTDVYVGGKFTSAGGVSANNIAKWNGSSWSALGSGISGDLYYVPVSVIAVSGTDVYVGGELTTAGGVPANRIAKWNGSSWSALGSGIGGIGFAQVLAIAISGSDVYAGGSFVTAGGAPGNYIAKWNGSSWSSLGSGTNGNVFALAVSGTDVYAGGSFGTAGGTPVNNIAKWNGSSWSPLGSGVGPPGGDSTIVSVSTLATSGTEDLYVGGGFPSVGEVPGTSGIAKWNGSSWSALGSGIEVSVSCDSFACYYGGPTAIAISGSDVYVGGPTYSVIFKWNGTTMSRLGSGTNGSVSGLAVLGSDLYVGGEFSIAGCHAASNFSRYSNGTNKTPFDFDGDGRSDLSVRRPSDGNWYILRGTAGYMTMTFGVDGDAMVPADYDGDGKTDVAVFRPSTGQWFIFNIGSQTFQTYSWGASGDLPVPADHDGDGKADLVVFRQSTGQWFTRFSLNNSFSTVGFGVAGDKPVIGDFDGDGKADIALYRPSDSNWYILKTGFGFFIQTWGEAGDVPVPADYDGDGKTDVAVFRPSTGQWLRIRSTAGFDVLNWGVSGDKPIAADYDGDGKADVAVFRPSSATWYIVGSSSGQIIQQYGQTGDLPTEGAFIY